MSKIEDGRQLTGNSNIFETMTHIIKIPTATTMFSGSTFLVMVYSDFVRRRCALEIQGGSQITRSTNNFAGFTDTQNVVPKPIHGFMTVYETPQSPAIMADATSCLQSKMAAN